MQYDVDISKLSLVNSTGTGPQRALKQVLLKWEGKAGGERKGRRGGGVLQKALQATFATMVVEVRSPPLAKPWKPWNGMAEGGCSEGSKWVGDGSERSLSEGFRARGGDTTYYRPDLFWTRAWCTPGFGAENRSALLYNFVFILCGFEG